MVRYRERWKNILSSLRAWTRNIIKTVQSWYRYFWLMETTVRTKNHRYGPDLTDSPNQKLNGRYTYGLLFMVDETKPVVESAVIYRHKRKLPSHHELLPMQAYDRLWEYYTRGYQLETIHNISMVQALYLLDRLAEGIIINSKNDQDNDKVRNQKRSKQ